MTKPFIKICTPYYNEWQQAPDGRALRNTNPLPIEMSVDALAGAEYQSGQIVERDDFTFKWERARGTYIARTRNALVNRLASEAIHQKLHEPYTHYLFVDSDIEFTAADILGLLRHDVPIISGVYVERTHQDSWCCGGFDGRYLSFDKQGSKRGMHEVEWCGAGFLLVKRGVFESVPYRWFSCIDISYVDGSGRECITSYEEDTSFCINCKKHGYKICAEYDIVVRHHLTNRGVKMSIDKISELKVKAYDFAAQRDYCTAMLQQINAEIAKLMQTQQAAPAAIREPQEG